MKTRIVLISILVVATVFVIAQSLPISRFPNVGTPLDSDLFVLAQTQAPATNKNIRYDQLRGAIRSGLAIEANTFARLEVQTNGVRIGLITNVNFASGITGQLSGTTAILGTIGGGGALAGSTNVMNFSVQAAKLPTADFPTIDASWNDWELVYYQTNDAGSKTSTSASWQFVVPNDYATNSMNVRLLSTITVTNGPNTSNVIYGVSFFRAGNGATNDLHNLTFRSEVTTNIDWTASPTATNLIKSSFLICDTNSGLAANELAIVKVSRKGASDTAIAPSAIVGVQLEYTRR